MIREQTYNGVGKWRIEVGEELFEALQKRIEAVECHEEVKEESIDQDEIQVDQPDRSKTPEKHQESIKKLEFDEIDTDKLNEKPKWA